MEKEKVFALALQELVKIARTQGNVLSEEQVKEPFEDMHLDKTQFELIQEYLKQNKIGIDKAVNPEDYLTEEDVHYLDIYLEELRTLEQWTEEKKKEVTGLAMKGNVQAQAQLIEAYLTEIVEISKLYAGQGVLLEDLIGEGNVAITLGVKLLECVEDIKEAEGVLVKTIMDAMEKYINENLESGEADKKILEKINKIAELSKELAENMGRKVTVDELIRESDYTEDEIMEAIEITAHNMEYIEVNGNANE